MRRLNFLLITVFLWNNTNAQDIGLQFAKSLKGATSADHCQINTIQVNENGTMFLAGYFKGTIDFDPDDVATVSRTSTGNAGVNLFIARYNSDGELPNSSSLITSGDNTFQYINGMALNDQDIYVMGAFGGVASFPATLPSYNTITTNGDIDFFIGKFSESLVNKWAYAIGGTGVDHANGLEVDEAGNIYLTGAFKGTVDFDPSGNGNATTLTANGSNSDIFIAKYNTDGELLWAHGVGGSFADEGEDLVIDPLGNVYVTGTFYGNVDFDPGSGSTDITGNPSVSSVFIAKYSANGDFIWARSVVGGESVAEIAINHNSDDLELAITGYFQQDNSDFDPGLGEALLPYENDVPDGFVGVYSNEGNYLWAKSIGGPNSSLEIPESVSFGEDGSLFVSGGGGGTIEFNLQGAAPYSLTSPSGDGFLARYDASGDFQSAFLIGGTGADWGAAHTIKDGNLILRGRIRSPSIDFDPSDDGTTVLTSTGMEDAYFAKYDYSGPDLIQNNTAATATDGSDLNVNFEIADAETGVQSVAVDYRGVSSGAGDPYKRVPLTNSSGNVYEGAIPADDFDELGIEFTVVATNNVGVTSTTEPFFANLSVPDGLPITQHGSGNGDQTDYRIISVPLELQEKTVTAVFEDDLGKYNPEEYRLFSYENGTTTELSSTSSIGIGKGYWIVIAGKDRSMDSGAGETAPNNRSQFFTIDLVENWNLLGNPYNFNVSWADVQDVNAGLASLRIYDGSFKNGDQLKKMEGGFVFAATATTIEIPTTKKTSINAGRKSDIQDSSDKKPLRRGEWELTLALKQGNSSYDLGGIGMRMDAEMEFDEYDDFSLPRIGNFIELNHDKEFRGIHYSRDVIPPASKQVWVFTVTTAKGGSTSIKWDNTDIIGLNNDLVLVDLENQWPVDMKSHSEYTFASNGSHRFKTVYGNKEFVRKEIVADQFTLNGVYPNPTHSQNKTHIAFSVPENGYQRLPVSINVISMLGQTVVTLPPTYYEPGLHTVNLPLVTPKETIPPGVYLVQVNYGDLKKQKRLIIKK